MRLGRHEPSVPAKFGLGLLFMGLAFVIMMPAGAAAFHNPSARPRRSLGKASATSAIDSGVLAMDAYVFN